MKNKYLITVCSLLFVLLFSLFSHAETDNYADRFNKLDNQGKELAANTAKWAMVRDNSTGLFWEIKTEDGSIHDKNKGYTWNTANKKFIAQLNKMKFGGFSDWHLPTTDEFNSIYQKGEEPYIDQTYFPHTLPTRYIAWYECCGTIVNVRFRFGTRRNTTSGFQVRAVRGGH